MGTMLSKNLKTILSKKDMSQRELAEKAGISTSTIHDYVHNDRIPKRRDNIKRLCKALNCTEAELMGYETPGASSIEYYVTSLKDIKEMTSVDMIPNFEEDDGYVVPKKILEKYGRCGSTAHISTEDINKYIPQNSWAYFVPETNFKAYNGHICAIYRNGLIFYRRAYIISSNVILETQSYSKENTKEFIDLDKQSLEILGRCVWFDHDEKGL